METKNMMANECNAKHIIPDIPTTFHSSFTYVLCDFTNSQTHFQFSHFQMIHRWFGRWIAATIRVHQYVYELYIRSRVEQERANKMEKAKKYRENVKELWFDLFECQRDISFIQFISMNCIFSKFIHKTPIFIGIHNYHFSDNRNRYKFN